MKTYVALLRGINVSGQNKIKMADLKLCFEEIGFSEVQTYIQSGNVIFKGEDGNEFAFAKAIQQKITSIYSFEVPVLVLKANRLVKIFDNCPFDHVKKESSYFTLLHKPPIQEVLNEVNAIELKDEEFFITPDCIYLFAHKGYGKAKGNNNFFERKLKVTATTRNYKTMLKLLDLSS